MVTCPGRPCFHPLGPLGSLWPRPWGTVLIKSWLLIDYLRCAVCRTKYWTHSHWVSPLGLLFRCFPSCDTESVNTSTSVLQLRKKLYLSALPGILLGSCCHYPHFWQARKLRFNENKQFAQHSGSSQFFKPSKGIWLLNSLLCWGWGPLPGYDFGKAGTGLCYFVGLCFCSIAWICELVKGFMLSVSCIFYWEKAAAAHHNFPGSVSTQRAVKQISAM